MGFSFRKSKSLGPVRLNLSKSGIGVSTGIKGARVSFGPKGTFVNLGRNGIYYRKKIGTHKAKTPNFNNKKSITTNNRESNPQPEGTLQDDFSDAIRVYDNSYSESVLGNEIIKDIWKSRILLWLWIILSVVLVVYLKQWGALISVVLGILFFRFFTASVVYELDSEANREWQILTDSLNEIRTSKCIWLIEKEQAHSNQKVHAGAFFSVVRSTASAKLLKPNRMTGLAIETNVNSFIIKNSKCTVLFIPSGIIVKKGVKTIAFSYDQINIFSTTRDFIQDGNLPRDAEVVRYTWQYVNKDGSPDRRYKNNRQIPVCRYGSISISGLNISIELQTSNKNSVVNLDSAYTRYKIFFGKMGNAPSNRKINRAELIKESTLIESNNQEKNHNYKVNNDDNNDYSDVLSSGADLFSRDIGAINSVDSDIYEDLFELDNHNKVNGDKTDPIGDVLEFFDEE